MRTLFGKKKQLKTGKEGKIYEFPTIVTIHTSPELINKWVEYSTMDSEVTFFLHEVLKQRLFELKTNFEHGVHNLLDLYNKYWVPFGELLTEMERIGFQLDLDHLKVENKIYINQNIYKERKEYFLLFA